MMAPRKEILEMAHLLSEEALKIVNEALAPMTTREIATAMKVEIHTAYSALIRLYIRDPKPVQKYREGGIWYWGKAGKPNPVAKKVEKVRESGPNGPDYPDSYEPIGKLNVYAVALDANLGLTLAKLAHDAAIAGHATLHGALMTASSIATATLLLDPNSRKSR